MENQQEPADKKPNSEPNVRVFGEEVGSHEERKERRHEWKEKWKEGRQARRDEWRHRHWHHYHDGDAIGGLILLAVGVILLLNTFGLIAWDFWAAISHLWPVILIIIGVRVIFGWTWPGRILAFIVALIIILGVVAYGLIQSNSPAARWLSPETVNMMNGLNQANR